MSFNQFIWRNVVRNKSLYLAYFLSAVTSVTVFFSFMALAHHPEVVAGMNKETSSGVSYAAWIMYGFAFLFVLYSMTNFVRSRKREFGTLMIQGLSPSQLRKMVVTENLLLGLGATVLGCLLGLGFTQVMIAVGNHFLKLGYSYFLPLNTIGITVISFTLLFAIISLLLWWRLPRLSLQELLKAGKLGDKPIRFSIILSALGIGLFLFGFMLLRAAPGDTLFLLAGPISVIEIIASALIFHQASVMIIQVLKWIKPIFWRKTNLTILSDLAFRMKENARAFFLVSVISSLAFVTIGSLIGFQNLMIESIEADPQEVRVLGPVADAQASVEAVNAKLAQNQITTQQAEGLYYPDDERGIGLIRESDYNRLAAAVGLAPVTTDGQAIYIQKKGGSLQALTRKPPTEVEVNQQAMPIKEVVVSGVLPGTVNYVVPDTTELPQSQEKTYAIWVTDNQDHDLLGKVGTELMLSDSQIMSKEGQLAGMQQVLGPTVFIGSFIGVIFFLSAGSFIYFRLYSDLNPDIQKFKMLHKIGLSKKEMKRIISKQLAILFFTPITLALVNGYFGLEALYRMFDSKMDTTAWMILGGFFLIQVVYYLVARHFYFKKVHHAVMA